MAEGAAHDATDSNDPQEAFSPQERTRREAGPEETVWEGTYSAKDQFELFIPIIILTIAAVIGSFFLPVLIIWVIGLAIVIWAILLLRLWLTKLSVHYKLTTRRFYHSHGIISRTTDRIEAIDIDDVTCIQGIFDRMFGVGDIKIVSSDKSHPELTLRGIANAQDVAQKIDEMRQKERDRRGVYVRTS